MPGAAELGGGHGLDGRAERRQRGHRFHNVPSASCSLWRSCSCTARLSATHRADGAEHRGDDRAASRSSSVAPACWGRGRRGSASPASRHITAKATARHHSGRSRSARSCTASIRSRRAPPLPPAPLRRLVERGSGISDLQHVPAPSLRRAATVPRQQRGALARDRRVPGARGDRVQHKPCGPGARLGDLPARRPRPRDQRLRLDRAPESDPVATSPAARRDDLRSAWSRERGRGPEHTDDRRSRCVRRPAARTRARAAVCRPGSWWRRPCSPLRPRPPARRAAAAERRRTTARTESRREPGACARDDRERQRRRDREQRDGGAADDETRLHDRRPADRRDRRADARSRRGTARGPPAMPATCSESPPARWSSVATQLPTTTDSPNDAACQTASGAQPQVERPARCVPARGRTRALARREHDEHDPGRRDQRGRRERRTPRSPERHGRQREPTAGHAHSAVSALRDGRADRRAHVVAARDERRRRADAGDEAHRDREDRLSPGRARRPTRPRRRPAPSRRRPARRSRSQRRPIGTCNAACVRKSAVVNSPTTARPTP